MEDYRDRLAIRELIDRYTVCVSRRDFAGVADCYAPDGRWVTSVGHDVAGNLAVADAVREAVVGRAFLMQMTHGMTIDSLSATQASATSILHEFGADAPIFVLGSYHDRIVKRDGAWKFAERYFQVHYIDTSPMAGTVMVDYAKLPPAR